MTAINAETFPMRVAALADETRLAILARLRAQDQCVCHLVDDLGLKQSVVSHHVGVLRRAGLITSYQHSADRRWLYYRLDRTRLAEIEAYLGWLGDGRAYSPVPRPCGADERDEH